MSKTYIAVNELHARPDLKKEAVITKAGEPFEAPDGYDVADLLTSGALRVPTDEEVKRFGIDDKKADKDAAKADKDAAKKAADDKDAAEKKAADAKDAAAKKAAAESGTTKNDDDNGASKLV